MPCASSTTRCVHEEAYVAWIKRYILFHNERHPQEMGASEIEAFLTDLELHATST